MSNSVTPTLTPEKTQSNKKLPLIVDIALDNNGKQLYQIHESSKLVRKEMPRSTNFVSNEEKTPVRKLMGTLSPSSQQKKPQDSDIYVKLELSNNMATTLIEGTSIQHGLFDQNDNKNQYNEIWSEEVEDAFEEILKIIPKNGLSKIKISGRSCGRNELISDYILTKTGKYRTRKQVSSHIQVIKNLGQKLNIISLINDGPKFASKEEEIANNKKFEEIFSKINLDKSLGLNESTKRTHSNISVPMVNTAPDSGPAGISTSGSSVSATNNKRRKLTNLAIENFYISVNDPNDLEPITFSIQNINEEVKELQIKENANISSRFPGLTEFQNSQIPIIHNMVKVRIPELPYNYSITEGLKSNYSVKYDNCDPNKTYSVFSCVYSFGNEIMKLTEDLQFDQNLPFLPRFWKYFFLNISNKIPEEKILACKGITIKQIIYERPEDGVYDSYMLPKLKIQVVLLWEFAKVDELKDATTTSTRLTLPRRITSDGKIESQSVECPERSVYFNSDAPLTLVSPMYYNQFSHVSSGLQMSDITPLSTFDSTWNKRTPQSSIQAKFQNLQHQYPVQLEYSPQTQVQPQVPLGYQVVHDPHQNSSHPLMHTNDYRQPSNIDLTMAHNEHQDAMNVPTYTDEYLNNL